MTMQPGLQAQLAARLRRETKGEVLFSRADRGRYATDASIYQIEPVGVLVPRTIEDVATAMAIAREIGVPVLPRGGGTSQCGQTVNRALVLDCSKYLRNVLEIDPDRRRAVVEPGAVLSHLNAALKPHGLFFPVDPSTHARCTIGGMAANNSCGSKSIRYGLMADNVAAIDAILADGTRFRFGPDWPGQGATMPHVIGELMARLQTLGQDLATEIAVRFPQVLRRVGGYNIDALTPAAAAAGRDNPARLLVGSEGTLAISAALELILHPIKPRKALGICQFPSFRSAMEATRHLVALDPEAVELVDRTMIDLGRGIPIFRNAIDRMVIGEPESLLIVEFHGMEDQPLLAQLARLESLMSDLGFPRSVVRAAEPDFQAQIAEVREAGLNIMMSMKGDGKPISFIEDTACPAAAGHLVRILVFLTPGPDEPDDARHAVSLAGDRELALPAVRERHSPAVGHVDHGAERQRLARRDAGEPTLAGKLDPAGWIAGGRPTCRRALRWRRRTPHSGAIGDGLRSRLHLRRRGDDVRDVAGRLPLRRQHGRCSRRKPKQEVDPGDLGSAGAGPTIAGDRRRIRGRERHRAEGRCEIGRPSRSPADERPFIVERVTAYLALEVNGHSMASVGRRGRVVAELDADDVAGPRGRRRRVTQRGRRAEQRHQAHCERGSAAGDHVWIRASVVPCSSSAP